MIILLVAGAMLAWRSYKRRMKQEQMHQFEMLFMDDHKFYGLEDADDIL